MPEVSGTKDLRSYVRLLWRWKWLFLFFVIASPVVAYLIESSSTPVYQSSTLVGINSASVNSALGASGSYSTSNIQAIAQLVTTTPVADIAAGLLNPPGNPGQVAGEVTATSDPNTGFLTISAQDPNPRRAADIANAFATAIGRNLQQSEVGAINNAIKVIRKQLASPGAKDAATRSQLQTQLDQLQLARSGQSGGSAILQSAVPSGSPVGGGTRKTIELGLLIGVLLGFGAVVLAGGSDRRLRTPEDLERVTDLPLLAAVESSAFDGLSTTASDDEAFQMLRTGLMYFNVERQLDSVLVTSAGEKEGKTTVATRLALTAAAAGMNVVLVDADLRRAQVTARLGIKSQSGLGAVLAGVSQLTDALVDYPLETHVHPGGRLRVLPAGPPPPNPSALMTSRGMEQTVHELESMSDLVIVDTPAALAVSDPLALMRGVSGVVIVARMNRSSRQTIQRLQQVVESAHGNLLGVIATGTTAGPGYGHYYPKYYAPNGTNGSSTGGFTLRGRKAKPAGDEAVPSPAEAEPKADEPLTASWRRGRAKHG